MSWGKKILKNGLSLFPIICFMVTLTLAHSTGFSQGKIKDKPFFSYPIMKGSIAEITKSLWGARDLPLIVKNFSKKSMKVGNWVQFLREIARLRRNVRKEQALLYNLESTIVDRAFGYVGIGQGDPEVKRALIDNLPKWFLTQSPPPSPNEVNLFERGMMSPFIVGPSLGAISEKILVHSSSFNKRWGLQKHVDPAYIFLAGVFLSEQSGWHSLPWSKKAALLEMLQKDFGKKDSLYLEVLSWALPSMPSQKGEGLAFLKGVRFFDAISVLVESGVAGYRSAIEILRKGSKSPNPSLDGFFAAIGILGEFAPEPGYAREKEKVFPWLFHTRVFRDLPHWLVKDFVIHLFLSSNAKQLSEYSQFLSDKITKGPPVFLWEMTKFFIDYPLQRVWENILQSPDKTAPLVQLSKVLFLEKFFYLYVFQKYSKGISKQWEHTIETVARQGEENGDFSFVALFLFSMNTPKVLCSKKDVDHFLRLSFLVLLKEKQRGIELSKLLKAIQVRERQYLQSKYQWSFGEFLKKIWGDLSKCEQEKIQVLLKKNQIQIPSLSMKK